MRYEILVRAEIAADDMIGLKEEIAERLEGIGGIVRVSFPRIEREERQMHLRDCGKK